MHEAVEPASARSVTLRPFSWSRKAGREGAVVELSGWGRYPRAACRIHEPRTEDDLRSLLAGTDTLIARGNGNAYGDAALNPAATASILGFDRILSFDEGEGLLACEAGALLSAVIARTLPRGWLPPVLPGTQHASIGGMVAADVHGKNHPHAGSFARHVGWLDVMVGDGTVVRCSPVENQELFEATLGGMGLTGIVLRVAFRLMRIESELMLERTIRCVDIEETLAAFDAHSDATYAVAWIDCLSQRKRGRSLVTVGEHAPADRTEALRGAPRNRRMHVPAGVPSFLLHRAIVSAFNDWRFSRASEGPTRVPFEAFFFPLDRLRGWNRLYGERGLVQYQFAVPAAAADSAIGAVFRWIGGSAQPPFLAVLKRLGPGRKMLSFPMPGYTLALDFPATRETVAMLGELDRAIVDLGGRVYLAKDAISTLALIAASYPDLARFSAVRDAADPRRRFSSLLSRRLGL